MAAGRTRVALALDVDEIREAERIVDLTQRHVDLYKIGPILFTRYGPGAVEMVRRHGKEVFLDLKFHDIPNTVAGGVRAASGMGVSMLTVHCSGGVDMMRAALKGAAEGAAAPETRTKVIGVTVLTSVAAEEAALDRVLDLAGQAARAEIDGVVCSPMEVAEVKRAYGKRLIAVVPGIRLGDQTRDDQARIATPRKAARDGADYIVVGRSVIGTGNPLEALERILQEVSDV